MSLRHWELLVWQAFPCKIVIGSLTCYLIYSLAYEGLMLLYAAALVWLWDFPAKLNLNIFVGFLSVLTLGSTRTSPSSALFAALNLYMEEHLLDGLTYISVAWGNNVGKHSWWGHSIYALKSAAKDWGVVKSCIAWSFPLGWWGGTSACMHCCTLKNAHLYKE